MPRPKSREIMRGRNAGMQGEMSIVRSLQSYHSQLVAERETLDERIAKLEAALDAVGAGRARAAAPRRAGRGPQAGSVRPGSLKDHIRRVLDKNGQPMAVKDITAGVTKSGYKSKNKTLAKSVGIALTEIPGVRKLGRGLFAIS